MCYVAGLPRPASAQHAFRTLAHPARLVGLEGSQVCLEPQLSHHVYGIYQPCFGLQLHIVIHASVVCRISPAAAGHVARGAVCFCLRCVRFVGLWWPAHGMQCHGGPGTVASSQVGSCGFRHSAHLQPLLIVFSNQHPIMVVSLFPRRTRSCWPRGSRRCRQRPSPNSFSQQHPNIVLIASNCCIFLCPSHPQLLATWLAALPPEVFGGRVVRPLQNYMAQVGI